MRWKWYVCVLCSLAIGLSSCKKESKDTGGGNGVIVSTEIPSGAGDGVTYINSGKSAIFNLFAPGKSAVSVIGEFNNWKPTAMTKTTDGTRWWVQIDNLDPSKEYAYQYYIDNTLKVADPYSHKILDPVNDPNIPATVYPNLKVYPTGSTTGIVSVMQGTPDAYTWKVPTFTRPDPKNLVIYEALVRDFSSSHSYQTLTDSLSYLVNLGINAIELMPVNEFEGNDSWGYNSNFMLALDKYYGTPNAYKAFIDACHAKGIAVIQDIVLEDQFGSSPMVQMYATSGGSPSTSNPWFDAQNMHPDAVGYQLNHQSAATQYFTENVMKYWMQEYHIDGYRFDEAKGFTQTNSGSDESAWAAYDAGRVATWTKYNSYMKSLDPNFYVILEYFAVDKEETELSNQGMILWNNLNINGSQATMSYNDSGGSWDLSRFFYDSHGFTAPYNLVGYLESHDEERLQYKNEQFGNGSGAYSIKNLATGLKRQEMAAAFLLASPGPKMIWQFGELGYDISIDQNGRTGDKPILWNYENDANRGHLHNVYAKLIKMKTKNGVFTTTNFNYSLVGAVKTIQLLGTDGTNVEVVGNFDVTNQTVSVNFPSTGTWYDNLSGTSITVNTIPYSMSLAPGEYYVFSNKQLSQ
jgi:glycosidase